MFRLRFSLYSKFMRPFLNIPESRNVFQQLCAHNSNSLMASSTNFDQLAVPVVCCQKQIIRFKSKNKDKFNQKVSESDSEDIERSLEGKLIDKNTKVVKVNVTSLRIDGLLKNALGIARNKIETMFYESKIRINGEKVTKKSLSVREGDEIDIIKGYHQNKPDLLVVARVEVLGASAKEDSISLKIRRCKSLVIENYTDRFEMKGQT